jgi:hypothetical protein
VPDDVAHDLTEKFIAEHALKRAKPAKATAKAKQRVKK